MRFLLDLLKVLSSASPVVCIGLVPMDALCGPTGVALLRLHGGSAGCGSSVMSAMMFLGVTLLFSPALRADSSQWTCAGDNTSFCFEDIGDMSILLSLSFANDCEFIDLSETAVPSSKVCARL